MICKGISKRKGGHPCATNVKHGEYCRHHLEQSPVPITPIINNKKCVNEGCSIRPNYNLLGSKIALYCSRHKLINMINIISITCDDKDCRKQPLFNLPGSKKGLYCFDHKSPEMIDVKNKTCEYEGCSTQPTYNLPGSKSALYCTNHKLDKMVDIINKSCHHENCSMRANYNLPGSKTALYCAMHKLTGMLNIASKTCCQEGCSTIPIYNLPGSTTGSFCKKHKSPEMIDIKNKTCKHEGCNTQPIYNLPGSKKGLYCANHKLINMVDIVNNICSYDGCSTLSCFNLPGSTKGLYCSSHKSSDMINIRNKTCQHEGCSTQPKFGLLGHPSSHCSTHKQKFHIKFPNSKCKEPTCKNSAIFGIINPERCETHQLDEDRSFITRKCKSCNLEDILDKDDLCDDCTPNKAKKIRERKELIVKRFLDENDLKYTAHDKPVDRKCGLERPDFRFDCGTHVVVLEVDENQHARYNEECECTRMINITQVIKMATIFIRYNPDSFKINKRKQNPTATTRHNVLKTWLNAAINKTPEEITKLGLTSIVKLYFDQDEKKDPEWFTIVPFEK
jgi:hypothetical protein